MASEAGATRRGQPKAALSAFDVAALVVGMVVGAGIFRTPGLVAEAAGSAPRALLAWALGGAVSFVGALCYVELATTYPHTGGEYTYLRRAFGPGLGFVFVWARLVILQSGSVAMLGFLLGDYAARVLPFGVDAAPLYAGLSILALTAVNLAGIAVCRRLQSLLAASIVLGLLLIVGCGLWGAGSPGARFGPSAVTPSTEGEAAFGLAMVFVLLTYGGWNEASYLSGEMRSGPKAFSRALLGGVFAVTVLYLLTNAVLFYSLGFEAVARSKTVAADLAQKTLGEAGAWLVSAFVIVAALATMNATIVTGARSGYALGCDYERLSFLGRWRAETGTPAAALLTQAALSLALVSFGAVTRQGFVTMVELTTPVFWLFLLLVGTALLVLRQKDAGARRPFPVPFYPLTPLLFCGSAAYMLFASVAHAGVGALVGLAVLGLGVPALRVARRRPYARGEV